MEKPKNYCHKCSGTGFIIKKLPGYKWPQRSSEQCDCFGKPDVPPLHYEMIVELQRVANLKSSKLKFKDEIDEWLMYWANKTYG